MEIGLRELRQQASDVIRRVEAGETFVVTVNGRAAALLSPVHRQTWRDLEDLGAIFASPVEESSWAADMATLDGEPRDPWRSR